VTEFSNERPIYVQMADRLCDEILAGTYKADDRVPSVREYSVLLGVNMNTSFKAFEQLAREGVIYNRRGLGYFVAPDAVAIITERKKREFMARLPQMFRQMRLLGISIDDIKRLWDITS